MRKNLPNILTVSRIVMVMIFVVLATLANRAYLSEGWIFPLRLGRIFWRFWPGPPIFWMDIWRGAGTRSPISAR